MLCGAGVCAALTAPRRAGSRTKEPSHKRRPPPRRRGEGGGGRRRKGNKEKQGECVPKGRIDCTKLTFGENAPEGGFCQRHSLVSMLSRGRAARTAPIGSRIMSQFALICRIWSLLYLDTVHAAAALTVPDAATTVRHCHALSAPCILTEKAPAGLSFRSHAAPPLLCLRDLRSIFQLLPPPPPRIAEISAFPSL